MSGQVYRHLHKLVKCGAGHSRKREHARGLVKHFAFLLSPSAPLFALTVLAPLLLMLGCSVSRPQTNVPSPGKRNLLADPGYSETKSAQKSSVWSPPRVDQETIQVTDGVVCPVRQVLDGVMHRVNELAANMNRFAATEHVLHQDLNSSGRVVSVQTRKFDYVVSITPSSSGSFAIDEFRDGTNSNDDFLKGISTTGVFSLAFIFSERERLAYDFKCEGLGEWEGGRAWIVYFRQRTNYESRTLRYVVAGNVYMVGLKGRAWIAADSLQIQHLEADLVDAVPKIGLREQHEILEYKPIFFTKRYVEMWLPARADLYIDLRNHKFHRIHNFDSYLLFSVVTSQKISIPKELTERPKQH